MNQWWRRYARLRSLVVLAFLSITFQLNLGTSFQQANQDNPDQHYRLAKSHLEHRSYSEAIAEAEAALEKQPDFALAYIVKGDALIGLFRDGFRKGRFAGTAKSPPASLFRLFQDAAESFRKCYDLRPLIADAARCRESEQLLQPYVQLNDLTNPSRTVFLSEELGSTKARVIKPQQPEYPEAARKSGIRGSVTLIGIVGTDGKIANILIVETLPTGFTEKAIEAAQKTRFKPATKNGQNVGQFISIKYDFMVF